MGIASSRSLLYNEVLRLSSINRSPLGTSNYRMSSSCETYFKGILDRKKALSYVLNIREINGFRDRKELLKLFCQQSDFLRTSGYKRYFNSLPGKERIFFEDCL